MKVGNDGEAIFDIHGFWDLWGGIFALRASINMGIPFFLLKLSFFFLEVIL